MTRFLISRLIQFPLILAVIYLVTFTLAWVVPGSPFQRSERMVNPEVLKSLKEQYNADSAWSFLTTYPLRMIQLDFGPSFAFPGQTVTQILGDTLPVSLFIGTIAIIIATIFGVIIGTLAAVRRGGFIDWAGTGVALLGVSVPSFVAAAGLLLVFAYWLDWFPLGGWPQSTVMIREADFTGVGRAPVDWSASLTAFPSYLWDHLKFGILPAVALSLLPMAYMTRLMRVSMIDTLSSDYVRTARAKGVGKVLVIFKHALRNALIPVLSFLGPAAAGTLVGSFVVEQVFAIPGLGAFFVKSVQNRDQTLILACVMVYSVLLLTLNLLVDVSYSLVDPRIELEGT